MRARAAEEDARAKGDQYDRDAPAVEPDSGQGDGKQQRRHDDIDEVHLPHRPFSPRTVREQAPVSPRHRAGPRGGVGADGLRDASRGDAVRLECRVDDARCRQTGPVSEKRRRLERNPAAREAAGACRSPRPATVARHALLPEIFPAAAALMVLHKTSRVNPLLDDRHAGSPGRNARRASRGARHDTPPPAAPPDPDPPRRAGGTAPPRTSGTRRQAIPCRIGGGTAVLRRPSRSKTPRGEGAPEDRCVAGAAQVRIRRARNPRDVKPPWAAAIAGASASARRRSRRGRPLRRGRS